MATEGYSTLEMRARAVDAVVRGLPIGEVAEAYGVDRTTLFRWMTRHREHGEDGLHRKPGSGRPRKLQAIGAKQLWDIVFQPASEFGFETDLWTVGRVHQVIEQQLGISVCRDTIWRRLREAELTYQKPARQYFEIDEQARQEWLQREVPRIREKVRKFRAILYFQDEANVSLTALLGKTWGPRGCPPTVQVTGNRGAVSVQSAISRRGHLLFSLYDKRIASDQVIHFLDQMLRHHKHRHLVVVMDQAPPHVSKKTRSFIDSQARLHTFYLPKYSPDWNPDEKVWNHLKNHELKAHQARTKAQLKQVTHEKLDSMSRDPRLLQGLFFRCCVADLFG
jgi:transposase